jgi:hypothetical protein
LKEGKMKIRIFVYRNLKREDIKKLLLSGQKFNDLISRVWFFQDIFSSLDFKPGFSMEIVIFPRYQIYWVFPGLKETSFSMDLDCF